MNPLILFDYVYYRIANVYDKRFGYGESKELSGVLILSLFQFSNILVLTNLFKIKDNLIKILPNYSFIFGIIIICVLNYIRYIKLLNFSDLEDKWGCESNNKMITRGVLVIVYFLLSFYLLAP
jgi:hypothetical protein